MRIIINDTNVILQSEDGALSYTLLNKPNLEDYGNLTARPLVTSYHLVKETIWERFCQCMQELDSRFQEDPYLACYAMMFSTFYPFLLSGSQAKNILCYGSSDMGAFFPILQDFMRFLQPNSSLVALPDDPFIFSGLADGSFHGAVLNLDTVSETETICDAISKIRKNGILLLYTAANALPDEPAPFLRQAVKTSFASSSLYTITADDALHALAEPYTAAAFVLDQVELFSAQLQELTQLLPPTETDLPDREDCLTALGLLGQMESLLYDVYNYLEDTALPLYADLLKEAVADYCSRLDSPSDIPACKERLNQAAQLFFDAAEAEF